MNDTDALARLMIRLAGIIIWAVYEHKDFQETIDMGTIAWQKIKGAE